MADSSVQVVPPAARSGSPPPWSARVWCEILPVAHAEGQIVALARRPVVTAQVPGWCQELPPSRHPTEAVVHALAQELAGVFDRSTSVVHSTSWRYEAEHLVLTYLTVLQPRAPLTGPPPGFLARSVDAWADAAARTDDPCAIPVIDVLTHGLRHLAMLRVSDPTIAETLSEGWHELLAGWRPLPAGLLEPGLLNHCPAPPSQR